MINSVRDVFGDEGLGQLIAKREAKSKRLYKDEVEKARNLKQRVVALAKMREKEGYMAEVEDVEDGFLLHENHCPICVAATACQGFCRSELRLFQETLGDDAEVTRESHIVSGARRCTYRIVDKAS
jgi:predicted ArsR family transcriptional regulator